MEQNPLECVDQFKMRRFQKVPNRVNTNRLPPLWNRNAEGQQQQEGGGGEPQENAAVGNEPPCQQPQEA